jgi:hypothetical protein
MVVIATVLDLFICSCRLLPAKHNIEDIIDKCMTSFRQYTSLASLHQHSIRKSLQVTIQDQVAG